jgi:predicted small lipoprotein YifL
MYRPFKLYAAALLAVLMSCAACGKKVVKLNPDASVPAATATAHLTTDSNANTIIDLKVQHLAKPENLTPPKAVYLVWIQPRGRSPIKQGQLQLNDNLEGEFKSPTTYKSFDIFVTAEDSASATEPTGTEVLRQTVTG